MDDIYTKLTHGGRHMATLREQRLKSGVFLKKILKHWMIVIVNNLDVGFQQESQARFSIKAVEGEIENQN